MLLVDNPDEFTPGPGTDGTPIGKFSPLSGVIPAITLLHWLRTATRLVTSYFEELAKLDYLVPALIAQQRRQSNLHVTTRAAVWSA
jgi:hypothetical protein